MVLKWKKNAIMGTGGHKECKARRAHSQGWQTPQHHILSLIKNTALKSFHFHSLNTVYVEHKHDSSIYHPLLPDTLTIKEKCRYSVLHVRNELSLLFFHASGKFLSIEGLLL